MDIHGLKISERPSTDTTGAVYHIIYAFNETAEAFEVSEIALNKLDWNCSEIGCWRRREPAPERPSLPCETGVLTHCL